MKRGFGLVLVALAGWLRYHGQAAFEKPSTHDKVGRVLLAHEADPAAAAVRHSAGLAVQFLRDWLVPEVLFVAGLLLLAGIGRSAVGTNAVGAGPDALGDVDDPDRESRSASGRISQGSASGRISQGAFLAGAAVLGLLVSLAGGLATHYFPAVTDEFGYLFQARLFSMGRVTAVSPAPPEFYESLGVVNDGQWYGRYPPGWPFLLAWLPYPPLFGTLAALALAALGWRYFGAAAACPVFLVLISPYYGLNAASFFPHLAQLSLYAFALWAWGRRNLVLSALAGMALGLAFLVRPAETVVLCAFLLLVRTPWPAWITLVLVAAFMGVWNGYHGKAFHEPISGTGHSFWAGVWNTEYRIARQLMWQAPGLVWLVLMGLRARPIVLVYFVATLGGLFTFYNLGQYEYGTRYLLAPWALAALLAAPGWQLLQAGRFRIHAGAAAAVVALWTAAVMWPGDFREARLATRDSRQVYTWLAAQCRRPTLVFVRKTPTLLGTSMVRNYPDLRDNARMVLFLAPDANRRLRALYPRFDAAILDFDFEARQYRLLPFDGREHVWEDNLIAGVQYSSALGDPESALRTWAAIPDSDPAGPPARSNSARLLFSLGRYPECLQQMHGLTLGPDMLIMKARALHAVGRKNEALRVLDEVEKHPGFAPQARGWRTSFQENLSGAR